MRFDRRIPRLTKTKAKPEGARRMQEDLGGAGRSQEPEGGRRTWEGLRGARSQEPEGARRIQDLGGAGRSQDVVYQVRQVLLMGLRGVMD